MKNHSLAPVFLEQSESICIAEILKLNEAVLPVAAHDCLHEFVNKFVVGCTANALLTKTDIQRIVQHGLGVGTHI